MSRNGFSNVTACGRRIVLLIAGLMLQACGLVREQAQVDPAVKSVQRFQGHGQPDPIIPDCSIEKWMKRADSGGSITCEYGPATKRSDAAKTVELPSLSGDSIDRRTQAQAELMAYADQICNGHIAGIYSKNATFNLSLGFLTTLFSGGAAVASGRAATNLAAESALFSGSRSLVNSEIYYGYIGPAVMTEIRAMRSDLRDKIASKRSCSIATYPPQEAIGDALIYHDACSFSTGLSSLLNKAGTTRVGEDKLRNAQAKALNAQLADKKAELKQRETDLGTIDKGKRAAAEADIRQLRNDIRVLEGVQRLNAILDPSSDQAAADTRAPTLEEQIRDVRSRIAEFDKEKNDAKAGSAEQKKAEENLRSANDLLGKLQTRQLRMELLPFEIAEARRSLTSAEEENARNERELNTLKASKNVDLSAAENALRSSGKAVAKRKATLQSLFDESEALRLDVGTRGGGVAFGIQSCASLQ